MPRPFILLLAALLLAPIAAAEPPPLRSDQTLAVPRTGPLQSLGLKHARFVPARVASISPGSPSLTLTINLGTEAQPQLTTFDLDPYPLRTPDFRVLVFDDNEAPHEVPAPAPSSFHGRDRATGDEIFATIINNRVRATIIPAQPGASLIYIQPLADAGPSAQSQPADTHAVYTAADAIPTNHTCGLDHCPECLAIAADTPTFVPRGPGACVTSELIADADYIFFQANGSSVASTVLDIETVLLGVNALYRNTAGFSPALRFAVKQVTVRAANGSDPYSALPVPPAEADSGTMLSTERTYWNPIGSPIHDVVHLFTGRDLNGAVVGLAYSNAMCSSNSYSLVQSRFSINLPARYAVSAHELGHNLSFSHDDTVAGGTNIMNSGINAGAPPTSFSTQSVNEYVAHIAGFTCLANSYPDVLPDAASTLPNRPILIDALANDGQGVICTAPITSFTLPSSTSSLGGACSISVGTGPGGRNQILYSPPSGAVGVEDSFNYAAGGVNSRVNITILTPRPPDQPYSAVFTGLAAKYYDIRNTNGSVTLYNSMPDLAPYPIFQTGVVSQLNFPLSNGNAVGSSRNFGMAATFDGFIQVGTTDFYQFWTISDDLSRVFIGSTLVVDNRSVQTAGDATGVIALAPGRHALHVDYTNYTGNTQLVLSYAYGAVPRTTVPVSALWRAAGVCHADFNGLNSVTVQDIFDFLNAWFIGAANADFNGINGTTVQDIFDFLNVWFGPC